MSVLALWAIELGAGCGTASTPATPRERGAEAVVATPTAATPPAMLPSATAELSAPGEEGTLGAYLTVVGAAPDWVGGLESRESAASIEPDGVRGVLVSKRHFGPLAWELSHGGDMAGYAGNPVGSTEPGHVLSSRIVRAPVELIVFDRDARWARTVALTQCTSAPCPEHTSERGEVVIAVPAGTAARFHIGPGWSIAISP